MDHPTAQKVRRKGDWTGAADRCTLAYEDRVLRRRMLVTDGGRRVLADLPQATALDHGDALELADGGLIAIHAAAEALLEITGGDLVRFAWHIGNRHAPCQIGAGRLLIRRDRVLGDMLAGLGATLREVAEPFAPEGGAYGHGRTLSHAH